jgi:hypothetical protein
VTHPVDNVASALTYTAAAGAATVWGLHLSDVAVMVSSLAAVCGASIQVMLYLDRRREGRRGVETKDNGETH